MGWFRKKSEPLTADEQLRVYHQEEERRRAAAGDAVRVTTGAPGELVVEDVFQITGRGQVVTGTVRGGALHVGDVVVVVRDGAERTRLTVKGIETFRKKREHVEAGTQAGLLFSGTSDFERGDIIRVASAS